MTWFRRRPQGPRYRHSYPQPGYVAVISAEVQDRQFVPLKLVRQRDYFPLLGSTGDKRWLNDDEVPELLAELTALLSVASPNDRLDIRRAAAIVEYGMESGTGVALAPTRVMQMSRYPSRGRLASGLPSSASSLQNCSPSCGRS
jgi:hypothetical protein